METNFSLPMALILAFFLAAPPSSSTSLVAMPEPEELEVMLEGQEELFERNVRVCLWRMAPLLPAEVRAAMAEEITDQWYESGFENVSFVTEMDSDEMETWAEAMEEEVLPALEDAGLAFHPRAFSIGAAWSYGINRLRAAQCATEVTVLQLRMKALGGQEASVSMPEEEPTAAEQDSGVLSDELTTPAEEEPARVQRIAY